jgi:hypothetical protein
MAWNNNLVINNHDKGRSAAFFIFTTTTRTTDVDHTKVADGAAVASWIGYITAHAAALNPLMEFLSFTIAILSGTVAIVYHLRRMPD